VNDASMLITEGLFDHCGDLICSPFGEEITKLEVN
jgi:hypothetical protein